jgi:transposase-like protein
MAGTISEKMTGARDKYWRERIGAQERSGLSVQQFCKEQGLNNPSFYYWRKRLRQQAPVRFALVEATGAPQHTSLEHCLELVLPTGERLRIGAGVDAAALRTVLESLRK